MPDIKWTLGVQVVGGPTFAKANSVPVDAYDKIEVTVPAGETDFEVQVGPTDADLRFLMVGVGGLTDASDLTYKVNSDTADEITLDSPVLLLLGGGAIGLLSSTASPRTLYFSNGATAEDAEVEILVGRDATP